MAESIKLLKKDFASDPSTSKFKFFEYGEEKTGFALFYKGSYYVYKNQCQHLPVELDWVDNNFLEDDDSLLFVQRMAQFTNPPQGSVYPVPAREAP